jgi:hypothetical protein
MFKFYFLSGILFLSFFSHPTFAQSRSDVSGTRKMIYGTPTSGGATAQISVSNWLRDNQESFAIQGNLNLVEKNVAIVSNNNIFTIFDYQQKMNGLPVEKSFVRILVKNGQVGNLNNPVILVSSNLAKFLPPAEETVRLTLEQAKRSLRQSRIKDILSTIATDEESLNFYSASQDKAISQLFEQVEGAPQPVIFFNKITGKSARVWKITITHPDINQPRSIAVFVSARDGKIIQAENQVYHYGGFVRGIGNIDDWPDVGNPEHGIASLPLENLQVDLLTTGDIQYTSANGQYSFSGQNPNPFLSANLRGRWVRVFDVGAPSNNNALSPYSINPYNFLFNPEPQGPGSFTTANVNAYRATNLIHNFFRSRAGNFNAIDFQIPAQTNINDTCNAYYWNNMLAFFRAGNDCANTAYSTIVAHEYGHFWVERRNLAQNAFGEGFADSAAILAYNTTDVGRSFYTNNGGTMRTPGTANVLYPCIGEIHYCGQTLGGVWSKILESFKLSYPNTGLEDARQLFVNWALVTGGEDSNAQAAHPLTAVEVLSVDDDNGNLADGTPHYDEICDAFRSQGIGCPARELFDFHLMGVPTRLVPNLPSIPGTVSILSHYGILGTRTAQLHYRLNDGSWTTTPLIQAGAPDSYYLSFPAQPCGTKLDYYLTASDSAGHVQYYPTNGPLEAVTLYSGFAEETPYSTNFEDDTGWGYTINPSGNGQWTASLPPAGLIMYPSHDYDGSGKALFTGNSEGGIHSATTTAVSPSFDLSHYGRTEISFANYLYNQFQYPLSPLKVKISTDNGGSWTELYSTFFNQAWAEKKLTVMTPLSNQTRLQLEVHNQFPSNFVVAVDALQVRGWTCENTCIPDLNDDGHLNILDFIAFMNFFAAQNTRADINHDTYFNLLDFNGFLNAYSFGCEH